MNDLYCYIRIIVSFILGILMIFTEIYNIKEDYKKYKKFTYILGM